MRGVSSFLHLSNVFFLVPQVFLLLLFQYCALDTVLQITVLLRLSDVLDL